LETEALDFGEHRHGAVYNGRKPLELFK